jgi:hypothetical protein
MSGFDKVSLMLQVLLPQNLTHQFLNSALA